MGLSHFSGSINFFVVFFMTHFFWFIFSGPFLAKFQIFNFGRLIIVDQIFNFLNKKSVFDQIYNFEEIYNLFEKKSIYFLTKFCIFRKKNLFLTKYFWRDFFWRKVYFFSWLKFHFWPNFIVFLWTLKIELARKCLAKIWDIFCTESILIILKPMKFFKSEKNQFFRKFTAFSRLILIRNSIELRLID